MINKKEKNVNAININWILAAFQPSVFWDSNKKQCENKSHFFLITMRISIIIIVTDLLMLISLIDALEKFGPTP